MKTIKKLEDELERTGISYPICTKIQTLKDVLKLIDERLKILNRMKYSDEILIREKELLKLKKRIEE